MPFCGQYLAVARTNCRADIFRLARFLGDDNLINHGTPGLEVRIDSSKDGTYSEHRCVAIPVAVVRGIGYRRNDRTLVFASAQRSFSKAKTPSGQESWKRGAVGATAGRLRDLRTNCSTARSSSRLPRPGLSLSAGDITPTQSARMAHWDTRLRCLRSSSQPSPRGQNCAPSNCAARALSSRSPNALTFRSTSQWSDHSNRATTLFLRTSRCSP